MLHTSRVCLLMCTLLKCVPYVQSDRVYLDILRGVSRNTMHNASMTQPQPQIDTSIAKCCDCTNKTNGTYPNVAKCWNCTKKNKKTNPGTLLSSSLRIPGPQAQDPVRIGFFGFFGTVSEFCNICVGFIGFLGTVQCFEQFSFQMLQLYQ